MLGGAIRLLGQRWRTVPNSYRSSHKISICVKPLSPSLWKVVWRWDMCTCSGLCYIQERNPKCRELKSLQWAVHMPPFVSDRLSFCQDCSLYKYPWKDWKSSWCLCFQDIQYRKGEALEESSPRTAQWIFSLPVTLLSFFSVSYMITF